jgi:hypothetical protein
MENEMDGRLLTFKDLRNGTDHKFDDISSEIYREYHFSDGYVKRIDHPIALNVNYSSGGHRVWDAYGKSHYVKGDWKDIVWEVFHDKPHFVK